jgi:predicted DNA-binding transcriptional regulator AlpA
METMRKEGRGPSYVRTSNKLVRYRVADLRHWMEQHLVRGGRE